MPSAPVMGEGMVSTTVQAERAHAVRHPLDRQLVRGGITHNATFAHVLAACLELGFDEDDGFVQRRRGGKDRGQNQRGGDEGNIHHHQSFFLVLDEFRERAGLENRAFVRSRRRTRGSLRSFISILPKPVSTAVTCAAPC